MKSFIMNGALALAFAAGESLATLLQKMSSAPTYHLHFPTLAPNMRKSHLLNRTTLTFGSSAVNGVAGDAMGLGGIIARHGKSKSNHPFFETSLRRLSRQGDRHRHRHRRLPRPTRPDSCNPWSWRVQYPGRDRPWHSIRDRDLPGSIWWR